ncbi:IQSEC1 family protein [Megaselia abdita]
MIICISGFIIGSKFPADQNDVTHPDPFIPPHPSEHADHISLVRHNCTNQNYESHSVSNFEGQQLTQSNGDSNQFNQSQRCRSQSNYELSRDTINKQIELLERKYGGFKARKAAIAIQRAFRHFMMVNKFSSMANIDKKPSKVRLASSSLNSIPTSMFDNNERSVVIGANRIPPLRPLSLRETHPFQSSQVQQFAGTYF